MRYCARRFHRTRRRASIARALGDNRARSQPIRRSRRAEAERDKTIMADFSAIRGMEGRKRVIAFPRHCHTPLDHMRKNYCMSGIYWDGGADADACDPRAADFTTSRYRYESLNLRALDNRFAFLYESASPLGSAPRGAAAARIVRKPAAGRRGAGALRKGLPNHSLVRGARGAVEVRPVPGRRYAVLSQSVLRRERYAGSVLPERPPRRRRRPARRAPRDWTRKPQLRLRAARRRGIQRQAHGDPPAAGVSDSQNRNGAVDTGRRTGVGREDSHWGLTAV